jgi:chlorobactene glucosyltransferase
MVLLVYQLLVLFSLLVFFGILLMNLRDLAPLPAGGVPARPFVSVLVPARNEELNIERCVTSLLQQDYPDFEIIVVDDGSTDATPLLLQGLLEGSGGRLRLLKGESLPAGWHGKAWACFQLSREAKGELLLFTDADTFHEPDALRKSADALLVSGADMLSLTPRQELGSFWEKLVVPLVYVILMCYLPLRFVSCTRIPAFCFANGQFILFRKEIYRKIQGHAAVRDVLVEDVWLCRAVKKAGGRVVAFDGTDSVSCRMYRTPGAVWEGFSKNLFAGFGYRTAGFFMLMLLVSAFYIFPYGFLFFSIWHGLFTPAVFWLPLVHIVLALLSRIVIALKFRQPLLYTLLHLLSQIVLLAIAVNSFYLVKSGRGAAWKGRRYNFS